MNKQKLTTIRWYATFSILSEKKPLYMGWNKLTPFLYHAMMSWFHDGHYVLIKNIKYDSSNIKELRKILHNLTELKEEE